jgi:hypothetical protein
MIVENKNYNVYPFAFSNGLNELPFSVFTLVGLNFF